MTKDTNNSIKNLSIIEIFDKLKVLHKTEFNGKFGIICS
jgi:hypothetical protein